MGDFSRSPFAGTPNWGGRPETLAERLDRMERLIVASAAAAYWYNGADAARAVTRHNHGQFLALRYAVSEGDGSSGLFWFNSVSTAADDGVDVIQPWDIPGGGVGRWERVS